MKYVVAIDGPSGSGKGTMARGLTSRFSFVYLDTGLMYRVFGSAKISYDELVNFSFSDYNQLLNKLEESSLRSESAGKQASLIGADLRFRKEITRLQLDFIDTENKAGRVCVLDGRDIGTVVVPDAFCKFFVTADLEVRALRRFADLRNKDPEITLMKVQESLAKRDELDTNRDVAPLKLTDDYIVIDTSQETAKETLERMAKIVEERMKKFHL